MPNLVDLLLKENHDITLSVLHINLSSSDILTTKFMIVFTNWQRASSCQPIIKQQYMFDMIHALNNLMCRSIVLTVLSCETLCRLCSIVDDY
jgi:hypothetical protein